MNDQPFASGTPAPMPATSAVILPGVGELFRRSWIFLKDSFRTVVSFLIAPAIFTALYAYFATNPSLLPLTIVAFILLLLSGLGAFIAILNLLSTGQTGSGSVMGVYRTGASLFFPWLLVAIIQLLATAGGFLLLVIPGIMLQVLFIFCLYAFFLEGLRGRMALAKSWYYVKGNWWGVFGRFIAFGIVVGIFAAVLGFISVAAGSVGAAIISAILYVLVVPFSMSYMFLMYQALKTGKPEPAPEVLTKNRKRITIFTIIGLIAPVILVFVFGAIMSFIF